MYQNYLVTENLAGKAYCAVLRRIKDLATLGCKVKARTPYIYMHTK